VVPGDKSISHRAALLGALAGGRTRISGFLRGRDCLATLTAVRRLGADVEWSQDGDLIIQGVAGTFREPDDILDASNSGTTARLLLGVLAGQPVTAVLTGDESLRLRPMGRVTEPLARMGASFLGRAGAGRLPLAIRGKRPLAPGEFALPVASAQVKSALLLAGLQAEGTTRVSEPALSRDHTERMLPSFGCEVRREGLLAYVQGPAALHGSLVSVPRDPSSAIFLVVAATLAKGSEIRLPGIGLNPGRSGALEVLRRMGAQIEISGICEENGEPRGTLVVRSASLSATDVAAEEVPALIDEVPALAVAAALAEGTSVFRGLGELRAKESDRLAVLQEEFRKLGAQVGVEADTLVVTGGGLHGGRAHTHGDHRIAMALAIAGLVSAIGVEVDGAECVDVSFPGFWELLGSLAPGSL
jgi:3-phosphoshikimate 1-carboxyvinyltransferase